MLSFWNHLEWARYFSITAFTFSVLAGLANAKGRLGFSYLLLLVAWLALYLANRLLRHSEAESDC